MIKNKKIFLGVILSLLVISFSCNKNSEIEKEHKLLLKEFETNKTLENAVNLSLFYDSKYSKKISQIEIGVTFIDEARKTFPDEKKLEALQGNLYTKLGGVYGKKLDYTNALKWVNKGFYILDKAVEKYPDDEWVLLYRAINSYSVPRILGRLPIALKDLEKLNGMEVLSEEAYILTHYYYSKSLKASKDKKRAKEVLEALKNRYPNYKILMKKY